MNKYKRKKISRSVSSNIENRIENLYILTEVWQAKNIKI